MTNLDELAKRINYRHQLEQLEEKPVAPFDPSEGMELEELRKYTRFLYYELEEEKKSSAELRELIEGLRQEIKTLTQELKEANALRKKDAETISRLMTSLEQLTKDYANSQKAIAELNQKLAEAIEQQEVSKKHRFGKSSQKKPGKAKTPQRQDPDRESDRQDFDGTNLPKPDDAENEADDASEKKHTTGVDANRKGTKYNTMSASKFVDHLSDMDKLPSGSTLITKYTEKTYDEVVEIVEHRFEILVFLGPDGEIHKAYFPQKEDEKGQEYKAYVDRFPGTHATAQFLANLAFNKYQMDTPFYREMINIWTRKMSTCRQTLINWMKKGAEHLKNVVEILTAQALKKGAVVHCDETWYRLILDKAKKVYIWCLVNEAEKIVIFFYDNGSRSRESLKKLLGESEIDAMQSDGYNVYMYLDEAAQGADHLCCLAHARAKFAYALDQGKNEKASRFLDLIGELYRKEDVYKAKNLTAEQILAERQSKTTSDIISKIREELLKVTAESVETSGSLMNKALRYLNKFWDNLFKYVTDGRYSIDNLEAERCIRPITVERKNSMFFCSHKGAETSSIYHTIIETCKKQGYSAQEYFEEFFTQIIKGRRDYENLIPATIGIKKQLKKH